ncbi:MAG: 3'-5' exonuclease, partial [Clostridia bacterium]
RRLAYVAITRAKKRLYIIYANERLLYGSYQRNKISRFINEIPEELFIKEGYITKKDRYIPHKATGFVFDTTIKKTMDSNEKFHIGDNVTHRVFGKGKIINAEKMANDVLLEIVFEKVGTKKIMANFAGLKISN